MPTIDFPRMIAETITSPFDQHATLLTYATTGAGKDWTCMAIGECVAQWVAKIKGGKPEDYFTVDNIAVITEAEVVRVLREKMDNPYSVVGFSDIGLAWNSRDFMQSMNKAMNDIYQTFRTKNLFVYMTLPDPSLIDIVPRGLSKFKLEIEQSHFELGYTQCKIFETVKKPRYQADPLHQYLRDMDGNKITKHIVFRPSRKIADEYTKRRREIEAISTAQRVDKIEEIINFDPAAKEKEREQNQLRKETEKEERKRIAREKREMELEEKRKARIDEKQKVKVLREDNRLMRDLRIIKMHNEGIKWTDIQLATNSTPEVINRVLKTAKLI